MYKPSLHDDLYTGPRWRYGLQHRPITSYFNVGAFPDPILFSHRWSTDARFPHGEADWPAEIPADEASHHSLELISWTVGEDAEAAFYACHPAD